MKEEEGEPRTSTVPESKARGGTTRKGRQQQGPLGALGEGTRQETVVNNRRRPGHKREGRKKNRQRRKASEETAWRTVARRDVAIETKV